MTTKKNKPLGRYITNTSLVLYKQEIVAAAKAMRALQEYQLDETIEQSKEKGQELLREAWRLCFMAIAPAHAYENKPIFLADERIWFDGAVWEKEPKP